MNVRSALEYVPYFRGRLFVVQVSAALLDAAELVDALLDADALHAMKEAGTVWVPTLSTIGNLLGKERFCQHAVAQILESALMNLEQFHGMGGLVAPGTDAGAWAVPHGACTEAALLEKAGITDTLAAQAVIKNKF